MQDSDASVVLVFHNSQGHYFSYAVILTQD